MARKASRDPLALCGFFHFPSILILMCLPVCFHVFSLCCVAFCGSASSPLINGEAFNMSSNTNHPHRQAKQTKRKITLRTQAKRRYSADAFYFRSYRETKRFGCRIPTTVSYRGKQKTRRTKPLSGE